MIKLKHDQNIGTKKLIYIYIYIYNKQLNKNTKAAKHKTNNKYERVITFYHFKLNPKLHLYHKFCECRLVS